MSSGLHHLMAIAAAQHGCFTRAQWRDCGLSDSHLTRSLSLGWTVRVHHGVHRLAGVPATPLLRTHAATLISPGQVFASSGTALHLHGITSQRDPRPHVTIPHHRRHAFDRRELVVHTSRTLHLDEPAMVAGIATVSIDRGLLETGMRGLGRGWLDDVSEAARRHLVTPDSLASTLEVMGPIPYRRQMRMALATLDARFTTGARSVPEVSLAHLVEEVTGRRAVLNHPVVGDGGGVVARVDVAVPELRLGFEGDSVRWHGAGTRQERDRRRDLAYDEAGWVVGRLMLSWLRNDVARARAVVVAKHRLALRLRGVAT